MKRILSIILASVMLFGCLVTGVSAEDIYLKLHTWAYEGSGIPENTDETRTDTHSSPEAYRAYVDNEDDFAKILERIRNSSIKNASEDALVLKIRYADKLTLEKFYSLYGYDELIKEYKEKYGEDLPKEDILSYKGMYRAKIFPYHKAVAERDFEVKFDYISYELSYGFGYPGADVKVAGDKLTFADVETLLKDDRVESVTLSAVAGKQYTSYPTDSDSATDTNDASPDAGFTDVPKDSPYYEYVNNVYAMGLVKGVSETEFAPEDNLTRAMLVTMIGRFDESINGALPEGAESVFTDVKSGKWYTSYISWAAEKGYVNGYPDGTFRPDAPVTREEALAIICRYYRKTGPSRSGGSYITAYKSYYPHTDTAEISPWALDWLLSGMYMGIVEYRLVTFTITGSEVTFDEAPEYYFEPKRPVTRAEAAETVYTALSLLERSIEKGTDLSSPVYPLMPDEGY